MQNRAFSSALQPVKLIAGLALLLAATFASAAPAGTVTHLSGTISAKRADGSTKLLSINSEIQEGDELSTQRDTYARIKFADGGEVVMRPETTLAVTAYAYNEKKPEADNVVLGLIRGGLRAITGLIGKRNQGAYKMQTSTATIGIRGTHFGALLCANNCMAFPTVHGGPPDNGLHVDVANGAIVLTNGAGQMTLQAGQFGFIKDNFTMPVIKPPQDGIRVVVPPAISKNNSTGTQLPGGATTCGFGG